MEPYEVWKRHGKPGVYSVWNSRKMDQWYKVIHGKPPQSIEDRRWFMGTPDNRAAYRRWLEIQPHDTTTD